MSKIKAYKFSMLISSVCTILLAVNYLVFKVLVVGVAFILGTIALIITFFCYKTETKNINK